MGVGVAEAGGRVWVGNGETVKVAVACNGWKVVCMDEMDSGLAPGVAELIPLSVVGVLHPARCKARISSNVSTFDFFTYLIDILYWLII
jgi:hypothetical protein